MTPTKSRNKNRGLRWLERALLAAGIVGIGIWVGSKVIPPLWQGWQGRQFENAKHASSAPEPQAASRPKNGDVLGRLSIPRLDISSMVREGDDETTLSLALGHIPSTSFPGQKGNVGIAGHRDTLFRALRNIHKDDVIQFETLTGMHTYEVDSTRIVKPNNVGVLKPRATPSLTLVTCYPFYYIGSAPERFIVSAHEIPAATVSLKTAGKKTAGETQVAVKPPIPVEPVSLHKPQPETRSAAFEIRKGRSQEIAPGVSIGITDTDPQGRAVYGWILLAREHRTILLSDHRIHEPVNFSQKGRSYQLRFDRVSSASAGGELE